MQRSTYNTIEGKMSVSFFFADYIRFDVLLIIITAALCFCCIIDGDEPLENYGRKKIRRCTIGSRSCANNCRKKEKAR